MLSCVVLLPGGSTLYISQRSETSSTPQSQSECLHSICRFIPKLRDRRTHQLFRKEMRQVINVFLHSFKNA